ncbi:MAG: AMP-binding protein [Candidatus Sericytochromatia bacterium]|nr:AMP-binding protein [Candidatus Sericytochromatia bacterium]
MHLGDVLSKNRTLRRAHAGKRVFILGNGPSLKGQDLTLLRDEIVIACNSFFHHPDLRTVAPAYWMAADPQYWENPQGTLLPLLLRLREAGVATRLFLPSGALSACQQLNPGPTVSFHHFHYDYAVEDPVEIDFSRPVPPYGQNVICTAIMLALHLGAHPIHLLGCDHTWWGYTEDMYAQSKHEHFYGGNGPTIQSFMGFAQLQQTIVVQRRQYELLLAYASERGTAILNATDGGLLDVFPRVRYEDLFPAPQTPEFSPARLAAAGVRALGVGDIEGAVALLERARESGVGHIARVPAIDLALAVALARLGHVEDARARLRGVLMADPQLAGRARCLIAALERDDWAALPVAAELQAWMFPERDALQVARQVSVLERIGEQRFEAGDAEGARQAFEEALALKPESASLHNNLAVLSWQRGETARAIDSFARALALDPEDPQTVLNAAAVHLERGALLDALAVCDAFLARVPSHAEVRAMRDEVAARVGGGQAALFPAASVHGCIVAHLEQDPGKTAFWLREGGRWVAWSRGDFLSLVSRHAARFSARLEPGSLVLFVKRLDVDLLAAYVGAMWAGMVPAQLSPQTRKTTPEEYARKFKHILDLTGARGIFTDEADAGLLPPGPEVFTPGAAGDVSPAPLVEGSGVALVQFSSGSTGLQKGVALTHEGILAHMQAYAQALCLDPADRLVSWLPLYHDMGLVACYLLPLMAGVPFLQMDPFDWIMRPDLLLEAIEGHQATLCFLPNFAYHVLERKGKERDLSSVRAFVNCSEPARPDTHDRFLARFPSVAPGALTVCYALAENTFAVAQTVPGAPAKRRTLAGKELLSCGSVLPGTEVRILEPDAEGVGEIGIKGACLFAHFLGGEAPMAGDFYRTGDLGFLAPDGELYVTGRHKDLIICNGKNIYPQDVEHVASAVPGVYPGRVVAFGVEQAEVGSEELIVVVERDGSVADQALRLAVQRAVEDEVGILPRRVEVVAHMSLVKTSSGKISRSRNKERYLSGDLVQG